MTGFLITFAALLAIIIRCWPTRAEKVGSQLSDAMGVSFPVNGEV